MSCPPPDSPTVAEPLPGIAEPERGKQPRKKHEPLWYVILHDDQLHTYEYVILMLMKLFQMGKEQAFLHAVEVDSQGVTIVARLPKEKAEQKRDEIMHFGGDPRMQTTVSMKASIEPCDD